MVGGYRHKIYSQNSRSLRCALSLYDIEQKSMPNFHAEHISMRCATEYIEIISIACVYRIVAFAIGLSWLLLATTLNQKRNDANSWEEIFRSEHSEWYARNEY